MILNPSRGGENTSDATGTAADLLAPKTMYGPDGKVTGTIPSKTAQTYTPSTADQTIAAGQYLSGAQTIKGVKISDSLAAANIKKNVVVEIGDDYDPDAILSVTGTMEGTDVSDTTATAGTVLAPEVFYLADGSPATGTIPVRAQSDVTASGATVSAPAGYYADAISKSVGNGSAGTPQITVGQDGLITATATQSAGYIPNGSKSATYQLPTTPGGTITPYPYTIYAIRAGHFATGDILVGPATTNMKSWVITSNGTMESDGYQNLVSGDSWVAQHYRDDSLKILVWSNQQLPSTTGDARSIVFAFNANQSFYLYNSAGWPFYGMNVRNYNEIGTLGGYLIQHGLKDTPTEIGTLVATSQGNIRLYLANYSTYTLPSGKSFTVYAWIDA